MSRTSTSTPSPASVSSGPRSRSATDRPPRCGRPRPARPRRPVPSAGTDTRRQQRMADLSHLDKNAIQAFLDGDVGTFVNDLKLIQQDDPNDVQALKSV